MKLLFVAGSFNQGGAEYQLLSLADLMHEKGHEVFVVALTDYDFYKPFLAERNIRFQCFSNSASQLTRVISLAGVIKREQPEVIFSYMKVPSMATLIATAISFRRPTLFLSERTALVKPARDFFHFFWWQFASVITTNSVTKVDYFKRNFPIIYRKLTFLGNVYGPEVFAKPMADDAAFIKDHENYISFVGRISPEKNILLLLEALSLVKARGYDFKFHMFGDNRHKEYFNQVMQRIEALNLKQQVMYNGPVTSDYLKLVYRHSDLICLLSDYEGFSNVLAETLIHGKCILASNIPENAYLVEDGKNGFLVDIQHAAQVAAGLIRFFDLKPHEKEQILEHNRNKAVELFDRNVLYEKVMALIKPASA